MGTILQNNKQLVNLHKDNFIKWFKVSRKKMIINNRLHALLLDVAFLIGHGNKQRILSKEWKKQTKIVCVYG